MQFSDAAADAATAAAAAAAAAAAKSLQSCLTLRDSMGCSLSGSSVHGIHQARVLEWGAIAFSEEIARCIHIDEPEQSYQWNY